MSSFRPLVFLGVLGLLSLNACAPSATTMSDVRFESLSVALHPYAKGLERPVDLRPLGDGRGRLVVAQQAGTVVLVGPDGAPPTPLLDLSDEIRWGGEQGLLSVALHPAFPQNGFLFVLYTDAEGMVLLKRVRLSPTLQLEPNTERVLLRLSQPGPTHNGGQLQFGPDGFLYLSTGDGEYRPSWLGANLYAQDKALLLGKLLRLDVDAEVDALEEATAKAYRVPPDNPFVGVEDVLDEIWALGLRNPWRFSFDTHTGALFVADVGETRWEEVNVQRAGEGGLNYGWPHAEGPECRLGSGCATFAPPAFAYAHEGGCAVTGGYVYRGEALPQLEGRYLYADFCSGQVWAARRGERGWETVQLFDTDALISTFGQDEAGEVYFADYASGTIYKLVYPER